MKKVMLLFAVFLSFQIFAQETEKYLQMSLEDLMNIEIVSASKKAESSFEAPLSSSVITKDELKKAGVTTLAEAFRLVPGLIVREQTNGVFDVQLRGINYFPYTSMPYTQNQITLVMIDNRVVFRDFQGGTYWEALPIEISDVERIEVIRGPSSALYGPNAVAGVINIITSRATTEEALTFNWQRGNYQSDIVSMNSGFKLGSFQVSVSGNYQRRNRYQNTYWDYSKGVFWADPDSIYSVQTGAPKAFRGTGSVRYPDRSLGVDKYGLNLFGAYILNENIDFDLSIGLQRSKVQKIYVDVIHTPFTTEYSESEYADLKANVYDAVLQVSLIKGYQNTVGVQGWEYTFKDLSFGAEYDLRLLDDKLSVRPGISFRSFTIDDELSVLKYGVGRGLVNGKHTLTTLGGALRIDYTPIEKLRLIAALRGDKYNHPDNKTYISYQFAATYKITENNLVRAVASRANKGANILDNYIKFDYVVPNVIEMHYKANQNLNLMTMDMFEVGYRSKLLPNLHLDFEAFYQKAKDFSNATGVDSIVGNKNYFSAQNLFVEPEQKGVTLSFNYVPNDQIQLKPFITWQETKLKNLVKTIGDPITKAFDEWDVYNPKWFGGLYLNYLPVQKLNINATLYYMSETKMKYQYNKVSIMYAKLLLDTKISYHFTGKTNVFFSLRNLDLLTAITNDKTKPETTALNQSGFADYIQPLCLFGIDVEF